MSWFQCREHRSRNTSNMLHDSRQAISALINHVEGKDPLSDLEIDQIKTQICDAISNVR